MGKFIGHTIFLFLLLPFVVQAAWWNPLSWFEKKETPILITDFSASTSQVGEIGLPTEVTKKVIEKPTTQEKIITKVVDNSVQTEEIKRLKSELQDLKNKYNFSQDSLTTVLAESVVNNTKWKKAYDLAHSSAKGLLEINQKLENGIKELIAVNERWESINEQANSIIETYKVGINMCNEIIGSPSRASYFPPPSPKRCTVVSHSSGDLYYNNVVNSYSEVICE